MSFVKTDFEPFFDPLKRKWTQLEEAFRDPGCRGCLKELDELDSDTAETYFCRQCQSHLGIRDTGEWVDSELFELDAVCNWSPWVKSLVYGYKFYRRQENQRLLVDLLFERATQILCQKRLAKPEAHPDGLPFWPVLPVLIIPIPARSPHRDHSQKLAKALSYRLHGGVYQPVLEWQREAKEQHHLGSAAARRHNIRGAFGLKASDVKACKNPGLILVIDDLMTTGSTMKEAIQTLQAAYDTSIVGLSVMNVTYGGQKRHAGAASEKLLTDVNCLETDLASVLFEADDAPEWVLPKLS